MTEVGLGAKRAYLLICLLAAAAWACDDVHENVVVSEPDMGELRPSGEPAPPERPEQRPDPGGAADAPDEGVADPEEAEDAGPVADAWSWEESPEDPEDPADAFLEPDPPIDRPIERPEDRPEAVPHEPLLPDPNPLRIPGCGRFGPADEVEVDPGVLATYVHGSPGASFGEPALSGCTPGTLTTADAVGFWQRLGFTYEEDRVVVITWAMGTPDGGTAARGEQHYDATGRLTEVAYGCTWGPGREVHRLQYDRRGRLASEAQSRSRDCHEPGPAIERFTEWRYPNGAALPNERVVRSRAEDGGDAPLVLGVHLEYLRDAQDRLVERRERTAEGHVIRSETFDYDADERIVRRVVVDRDNADEPWVIEYTYDDFGRVQTRNDALSGLLVLTYDRDGALAAVEARNPDALTAMGHPERSRFEADR
ncbi:MAG: hypothetical protein KC620_12685 [Myxococcales bacterium]|nr:hypothetical protein [Myxococcales bacterium]